MSVGTWIYLWAFYFVPLIYISVFVPVPYSLDDVALIIREMHTKTSMRYHYTPVRMAAIQKSTTINAGEAVEKREPSYTVGGNAN